MKHLFFTLIFLFLSSVVSAQYISGSVKDKNTGEPLIGAFVKVTELQLSSEVDVDGSYLIKVPKGTYTLEASYFSYDTVVIGPIHVVKEDNYRIDINMDDFAMELDGVVVAATQQRSTEISLLSIQQNLNVVMDGVSNQQIQRMGDGEVGSAVRRVSGVSVEGGKYVFVRGLGDRYSKTLLNGSEIPSLDPNKNSVQLDMFPTNMIDNISVLKTFSVDRPGDFTGGCVIINTKSLPDKYTLNFGTNFGFNTNSTFNDKFLSDKLEKWELLGISDGTTDLPSEARGTIPSVYQNPTAVDQITNSFNRNFIPIRTTPLLNFGSNLSFGNKHRFGETEFGYLANVSHTYENEFFEGGVNNRYILATAATGDLSPTVLLNDSEGRNNVLSGVSLGLGLRNRGNNLFLNLQRNSSTTLSARYMEGTNPLNTDAEVILQSNVLRRVERSLNFSQLGGEHKFGEDFVIDWLSAFTYSEQNEPDFRSFTNSAVSDPLDENSVTYQINPSNYKKPSRFYRDMGEFTFDNKLNLQYSYKNSKFKFGGSYLYKNRSFRERRLDYEGTERFPSNIGLMDIFADENMGVLGTNPNGTPLTGIYILDATERRNQYDGSQTVGSGYIMWDYNPSEKIKINSGIRFEYTKMDVRSFSMGIAPGNIDQFDILPGINFIYEPIEDMNLRISYSRTLARPNFREMAPFASFDFNQDNVVVGNPALNRVLSDNLDLRWEYFFNPGDIISISGFTKFLQNPIERIFSPVGYNEVTWRNVPEGRLFGLEFEVRKKFTLPKDQSISVSTNLTLVKSQVDIDPAELSRFRAVLGPDYPDTRRLYSQSPYLLNSNLSYVYPNLGIETNLNFNLFGERLSVVGTGTSPDVYERPRPMLNFMVSKKLGKENRFKLTLRCNNILDATYDWSYKVGDNRVPFQRFNLGREFQAGFNYSL